MIFSKYTDLLPKEVLNEDAPGLQKPDEEAIQEVRARRPQNYFRFECSLVIFRTIYQRSKNFI